MHIVEPITRRRAAERTTTGAATLIYSADPCAKPSPTPDTREAKSLLDDTYYPT